MKSAVGSLAHRVDELARELLDRRVAHLQTRAEALDVVADRVEQVRLADPGRAVQEERVVGVAGQLGDRERRGVREAVARADHELVEGVLRVQAVGVGGAAAPGPRRRRVGGASQSAPTTSTSACASNPAAAARRSSGR